MVKLEGTTLVTVAAALGKEYGIRVCMDAPLGAAYTEYDAVTCKPKTIHLSPLDISDSDYLAKVRGYVDHEAGHVRFSSGTVFAHPDITKSEICKNVHNIFEDVFVERKMGECFPGCARNLRQLEELVFLSEDYIQEEVQEALNNCWYRDGNGDSFSAGVTNTLVLWTLFAARSMRPGSRLIEVRDKLADTINSMYPRLLDQLEPIVSTAFTNNSSSETLNAAQCWMDIVKQYTALPNKQQGSDPQDGGQQGSDPQDGGQQGSDHQDGGQQSSDPQDGGQQDGGQRGGGQVPDKKDLDTLALGVADNVVSCKTSVTQIVANTFNMPSHEGCDIGAAMRVIPSICKPLPKDVQQTALRASVRLAAQLKGLLQAWSMGRSRTGYVGKLDTRKLYRLAVSNPRVFHTRGEQRKLDTEVLILADNSASMSGSKAVVASQALYACMSALRSLPGVKSGAYSFDSRNFSSICKVTDSMTDRMLLSPTGGTMLGDALRLVTSEFTGATSRKVVVILSDGVTGEADSCKQYISILMDAGVTVAGIGICDGGLYAVMPGEYVQVISDLKELTPAMFKVFRNALLHGV